MISQRILDSFTSKDLAGEPQAESKGKKVIRAESGSPENVLANDHGLTRCLLVDPPEKPIPRLFPEPLEPVSPELFRIARKEDTSTYTGNPHSFLHEIQGLHHECRGSVLDACHNIKGLF
jgi:hypothetical protein